MHAAFLKNLCHSAHPIPKVHVRALRGGENSKKNASSKNHLHILPTTYDIMESCHEPCVKQYAIGSVLSHAV
jgi:hypothetical protein